MMKMAASCSNMPKYPEGTAFQGLVEAFKSVSVQEIASAFCEAEGDVDLASQILCNMQQDPAPSPIHASNRGKHSRKLSESNYHKTPDRENFAMAKQKLSTASTGPVSSTTDKRYLKHASGNNVSSTHPRTEKPDSSTDRGTNGKELVTIHGNNVLENDLKEFLFKMLAGGFHQKREVIQHVLELCGYDIIKSMEKLLDLSPALIDAKREILVKYNAKLPYSSYQTDSSPGSCADLVGNCEQFPGVEKVSEDTQTEIMQPLHVSPEKTLLIQETEKPLGEHTVTKPVSHGPEVVQTHLQPEPSSDTDTHSELKSDSLPLWQGCDDDDSEDEYHLLRREVKEYRSKMMECYRDAVNAFASGDHDEANKLMKKGHCFHEKAREADEKSTQKIFEIKNMDKEDEISLDLRKCSVREAIRLLRSHLSSLFGIPSIKYLKFILETDDEQGTGGSKRSSIVKFMEKEQVRWTGDEDSGVITINLSASTQNS